MRHREVLESLSGLLLALFVAMISSTSLLLKPITLRTTIDLEEKTDDTEDTVTSDSIAG